jgi:hypothetical protein
VSLKLSLLLTVGKLGQVVNDGIGTATRVGANEPSRSQVDDQPTRLLRKNVTGRGRPSVLGAVKATYDIVASGLPVGSEAVKCPVVVV